MVIELLSTIAGSGAAALDMRNRGIFNKLYDASEYCEETRVNYRSDFNVLTQVINTSLHHLIHTSLIECSNITIRNNFVQFYQKLSDIIKANLTNDNIYISSLGTCNIEFESGDMNSIFSIEIGSKYIGYFCEENDVTTSFEDKIDVTNKADYEAVLSKINKNLLHFFENHNISNFI